MRWAAVGIIALTAFFLQGLAHSQNIFSMPNMFDAQQKQYPQPLSEKQKNAIVTPSKRALTLCVIDFVKRDQEALFAYRENRFTRYVANLIYRCPVEVEKLSVLYDRVYGYGTSEAFIRGDYAADLPRAVLVRTKDDIQRRLDEYDRLKATELEEDRRNRERVAANQRVEDARQAEASRRQEAEDRAAAAKAEAERKEAEAASAAAEAKVAAAKQDRVDVAKRTFALLKEKLFTCVRGELPQLVKSGESADVLASVSLTICSKELRDAQDGAVEIVSIEDGHPFPSSLEEAFREKTKSIVRERVLAEAVQAKAANAH